MNVIINPAYSKLASFIKKLPESFDGGGDLIYSARNQIKRFTEQGIDMSVKCYKVPIRINRFIYAFFRPSKARRAYEYAMILLSKGIRTPEPIAYIEVKQGIAFYQGYFISKMENYPRMMRDFHDSLRGEEHILKAFAKFTLKVHQAGILHLDYSPGNVLFEESGDEIHFSLVDLNRMRFGKLSRKECLHNFDRISPSDEVTTYIVSEYARLRGWDVDSSVQMALYYKAEFWRRMAKKAVLKSKIRKDR